MSSNTQSKEQYLDSPHGKLFVKQWRTSDAAMTDLASIVLVHDSLGCVALWKDFPEQLAIMTGRQVIAYDRLGFGRSAAHPDKLPADFIEHEAQQVIPELLAAVGVDELVALGHSVGGGIAVTLAAHLPERCLGLIAISTQAFNDAQVMQGIKDNYATFEPDHQGGHALASLTRYHGDKTRWVLDAWAKTWLSPAFADWSLQQQLVKVVCPSLVIQGVADEYNCVRHSQLIAEQVSGTAELNIMANTGHFPHRQHKQAVLTRVSEFLCGLDK